MRSVIIVQLALVMVSLGGSPQAAFSQCASCGAEYNQKERARIQAEDEFNRAQVEKALQNSKKSSGGTVDTRRVGQGNKSTLDKPPKK